MSSFIFFCLFLLTYEWLNNEHCVTETKFFEGFDDHLPTSLSVGLTCVAHLVRLFLFFLGGGGFVGQNGSTNKFLQQENWSGGDFKKFSFFSRRKPDLLFGNKSISWSKMIAR